MEVRHSLIGALGLGAVMLAGGCGDDAEGPAFTATLTGAEEAPGPGDTDGSGEAEITVNGNDGEVCSDISVENIDAATMAHVHEGATGVAGPVKVTVEIPSTGQADGCVKVDQAVAAAIVTNPTNFYVNVHNTAFPNGAVRGQLAAK